MRDRAPSSPGRFRRFLRKLCWVFGTVIVLYVLAGVVCDILIWAEWRRIAHEGDPVSIAQLAGRMPPDSENGALVYEKAFRLMRAGKLDALWDLSYDQGQKNPGLWAEARKEAPRFVPVMNLARKAASMRTCRFKADWEQGLFPSSNDVLDLAKYIRGYALLRAHDSKPSEAISDLTLAVRTADSLESDSLYIGLLLCGSIYRSAGDAAYRMACGSRVSESAARVLCDHLRRGEFARRLQTAMRWERVTTFDYLDRAGTRGLPHDYRDCADNLLVRFECSWIGRPVLRADELSFLLLQRHTVSSSHIPFRNLPKARDLSECHTCHHPRSFWPLSSMFEIGTDPFDPYPENRGIDHLEASINGARIAVAMRVYKQRFGQFPDMPNDLTKLGWKLDLIDPFTGREFAYRRIGEGFLLHSIGPDLKDDGGRPDPHDTWDQGDIVWRMKS